MEVLEFKKSEAGSTDAPFEMLIDINQAINYINDNQKLKGERLIPVDDIFYELRDNPNLSKKCHKCIDDMIIEILCATLKTPTTLEGVLDTSDFKRAVIKQNGGGKIMADSLLSFPVRLKRVLETHLDHVYKYLPPDNKGLNLWGNLELMELSRAGFKVKFKGIVNDIQLFVITADKLLSDLRDGKE